MYMIDDNIQVLIHLQLNIVNWEKIEGLVSYKWI